MLSCINSRCLLLRFLNVSLNQYCWTCPVLHMPDKQEHTPRQVLQGLNSSSHNWTEGSTSTLIFTFQLFMFHSLKKLGFFQSLVFTYVSGLVNNNNVSSEAQSMKNKNEVTVQTLYVLYSASIHLFKSTEVCLVHLHRDSILSVWEAPEDRRSRPPVQLSFPLFKHVLVSIT